MLLCKCTHLGISILYHGIPYLCETYKIYKYVFYPHVNTTKQVQSAKTPEHQLKLSALLS